jgi:hypothetical protein
MNKLIRTLALSASLGLASVAHAITWTDTSTFSPFYLSINGTSSKSGVFDITDNGFNPGLHTITSATASFAFADDDQNDDGEYVSITLDGSAFLGPLEVDGNHSSPPSSYHWLSGGVSGTLLVSLQTDGKLNWTVALQNTAGTNDTYLKVAKLVAEGRPSNVPGVPDGGTTAALLGISFLGLAAARRKLL